MYINAEEEAKKKERPYPNVLGLWAAGVGINYDHTKNIFGADDRIRRAVSDNRADEVTDLVREYCKKHGLDEAYAALDTFEEKLLMMSIVVQAAPEMDQIFLRIGRPRW